MERTEAFKDVVAEFVAKHGAAAAAKKYGVPSRTARTWAQDRYGPADNLGRRAGVPVDQILQAAHEEAKAQRAVPLCRPAGEADFLHEHPEFTDKKIASLDMWSMFDLIEGMQSAVAASGPGQSEARVAIPSSEPIILLPTGDWHLGSYASDHAELRAYIKRVLDTPGCYLMLLGDEVENFPSTFKSAAAVFGQVIPPKVQHRLLSKILVELHAKGRLVAKTWGNHNAFADVGIGGADFDYESLVPYLKVMGKLHLTVGAAEYRIFASHTFPGKSYLHTGHQNKRAVRMIWPEADIVLSGHTHSGPEHEQFWHGERPVVSATVGTAKTDDVYSKRYYGFSRWSDQAIVLRHDTLEAIPFRTLDQALVWREGWRAMNRKTA